MTQSHSTGDQQACRLFQTGLGKRRSAGDLVANRNRPQQPREAQAKPARVPWLSETKGANPVASGDSATPPLILHLLPPWARSCRLELAECRRLAGPCAIVQLDHDESREGSSAETMTLSFPSSVPIPDPHPSPAVPEPSSGPSDPPESASHPPTPAHATQVTSPVAPGLEPRTTAGLQSQEAGLDPGAIEMDAVTPAGHRRRRSSLINPANATSSRHRSPHRRSPSIRRPAADETKILEEGTDDESRLPGELDEAGLSDEDLHDDEETGLTGKDRRRKRRKRNRNQLLDQRIASDKITNEEKKEADRNVVKRLVIDGVLIGLWYLFSLLISLVRAPSSSSVERWTGC